MFCIAKNHGSILFENDYAQNSANDLLAVLKELPKLSAVSQTVKERFLSLAEICDRAARSFGSRMTVSVDQNGDAVRFLMTQRRFGAFSPQAGGMTELFSLATAFVATPVGEEICVAIDFALTDSLPDFNCPKDNITMRSII